MNPCPCGYAGSEPGRCRCGPGSPEQYAGRVSGPLRDRIDLWVDDAAGRAGGARRWCRAGVVHDGRDADR